MISLHECYVEAVRPRCRINQRFKFLLPEITIDGQLAGASKF